MSGDRAIIFRGEGSGESDEPGERGGSGPAPVRTGPEGSATHILTAPDPATAAALAAEYVDRGVTSVELCGATGYVWTAAVEAAVRGRARVRTVMYGFESLLDVADFKRAAFAGEPLAALFLYIQPGADPAEDRFVRVLGTSTSTYVAVPDPASGAAVAAEFADAVQLIEVYGDWDAESVAAVIGAVGERVPVGVAVAA
ncbi:DUF6506 family protein [Streptomyces sp. NPDC004610]|uniref:DUF6506 family protein n=1 Tax=unclassified Streptomyces TaxID=2593676 RepID=UPI0033A5CF13